MATFDTRTPSTSPRATMKTPPGSGRHRKRDSDPLADLPANVIDLSDEARPSEEFESLFSKIILGPLNMISFVLSLWLVDGQQRQWRVAQHSHKSESSWRELLPWTWWSAEPYQHPQDSTWQHTAEATNATDGIYGSVPVSTDADKWYMRKKHRKMARLELSDALAMKGKVTFMLIVWALLGLLGTVWAIKRMCASLGF